MVLLHKVGFFVPLQADEVNISFDVLKYFHSNFEYSAGLMLKIKHV